jgi:hypothetical protein
MGATTPSVVRTDGESVRTVLGLREFTVGAGIVTVVKKTWTIHTSNSAHDVKIIPKASVSGQHLVREGGADTKCVTGEGDVPSAGTAVP